MWCASTISAALMSISGVPAGAPDARDGQWMPGPGKELFDAVRKALGDRPVIAEDLGYLTDTVRQLVADCGFPGMKVMEFAFDARDSSGANEYLPHNYPENCVVYTGTHDNETVTGWFQTGITDAERAAVLPSICTGLRMQWSLCIWTLSAPPWPQWGGGASSPCRITWGWTTAPGSIDPRPWGATGAGAWKLTL